MTGPTVEQLVEQVRDACGDLADLAIEWCAPMRGRRERLEALATVAYKNAIESVSALQARVEAAEREQDEARVLMRSALLSYGRHGTFCAWSTGGVCDCGLDDAIAVALADTPKEGTP